MKPIEISTKRLLLKPLGIEYAQTANGYSTDYENTKYMCYLPNENLEETINFLKNADEEWKKEKPEFYEFAILYKNEHIGAVSIYFENGIGELGWIVDKKYCIIQSNGKTGHGQNRGEWGGRRNRSALQDSFEYQYELVVSR